MPLPFSPTASRQASAASDAKVFALVSHWRLQTSARSVWTLLTRVEDWPQWWPYVRRVDVLFRKPGFEVGTRCRLHWRSALVYGLKLEVETVKALEGGQGRWELEARASGDVQGRGLWLIEPVAGGPDDPVQVDVTYRWEVSLHKRWMRVMAPLLRPVFAWNHFVLMRAGAAGMARHLECALSNLGDRLEDQPATALPIELEPPQPR